MPCDRRLAILDLYSAAVNHHAEVTSHLETWAWDRVRFSKVLKDAEDARKDCAKAKRALEFHSKEHGC